MEFEWNESKAQRNLKKHGVSFEEAKTVFDDPLYLDFYDPDHSESENRFLLVRASATNRVLIVSHTERGGAIRIISAREATHTTGAVFICRRMMSYGLSSICGVCGCDGLGRSAGSLARS